MSSIQNRINIYIFSLGIIIILTSLLILFDPVNASKIIRSILTSFFFGFLFGVCGVLGLMVQAPRLFNMHNIVRYNIIFGIIASLLFFLLLSVNGISIPYFPIIGPIQDVIFGSQNYILIEYYLILAPICFIIGIITLYLSTKVKRLNPPLGSQLTYSYNKMDLEKEWKSVLNLLRKHWNCCQFWMQEPLKNHFQVSISWVFLLIQD